MRKNNLFLIPPLLLTMIWLPAKAFDSGSTGVDGVFDPILTAEVQLPADGVFQYESVNIRSGVTVTFGKNAANTPVTWLVQGDVLIDGVIDLSADGQVSGPGGFNGGAGGIVSGGPAGGGLGPGGGPATTSPECSQFAQGASFGTVAAFACIGPRPAYGNPELVPMIGGSGGAGGLLSGGELGGHGGGGGGAILIAASGTITINGEIRANGGVPGATSNSFYGGEGSGGAIRLVATTVTGEGFLTAINGQSGNVADAGLGRIRIEAENLMRSSPTTPAFSTDLPRPLFAPSFPSIRVTSVAGVAVPAIPTAMDDVELAASTPSPMTIAIETTEVPVGSVATIRVDPTRGATVEGSTDPTVGTTSLATASASIALPEGASTLLASVEFTVDSQAAIDYSPFAGGQLVARVRTSYKAGVGATTTFITEGGQEYTWPNTALSVN